MRILIVDDNEPLTYFVSAFLKSEGDFEVECEVDGDAAFQHYCQHGPYDLVVTDYAHPGMDGLELSRAIRKTPCRCGMSAPSVSLVLRLMDRATKLDYRSTIARQDGCTSGAAWPQRRTVKRVLSFDMFPADRSFGG